MLKNRYDKRNEDEGFTLIELLIVIIILGILAAIVVFAIGSTRKDAVASSCKTDAKSIQLSLEAQKVKNGEYPNPYASGSVDPGDARDSAKGALLRSWPGSATADGDYRFKYQSADGSTYSVSIDGKAVKGTPDPAFTNAADITTACDGT